MADRPPEFVDLWHSLKVPNETDLLKDLASGTPTCFLPMHLSYLTIRNRGVAGHRCRSLDFEDRANQEEGDVM